LKFGGTATKAYPHHTPAGKAMYQILGVIAEFERAMIVERVKSGLARARSQGKRLGRRPVSEAVVERIREQLATGQESSRRPKRSASAPERCIG
jgi:DNA invertase Pin-like site-specific DNA recombinase